MLTSAEVEVEEYVSSVSGTAPSKPRAVELAVPAQTLQAQTLELPPALPIRTAARRSGDSKVEGVDSVKGPALLHLAMQM